MEQVHILSEHEGAGDNTVNASISDASLEWDPLADGEYDLTTHPADYFTWSRYPDFNQNTPTSCQGCSKTSSTNNCIECSINIWKPNYPTSYDQTSFDDDFDEYKSCTSGDEYCTSGDEYFSCESDEDEGYVRRNASETQRVKLDFKTGMSVKLEVRLNEGCFVHGRRETHYSNSLNSYINTECNRITSATQTGIEVFHTSGNELVHMVRDKESGRAETTIFKSDTPLFPDKIQNEEVKSNTTTNSEIPILSSFNQDRILQKLQDPLENAANVYSNYNIVSISPSDSQTSEILEEPHYIVFGPKSHDNNVEDGEFVFNNEYNEDLETCMNDPVFDSSHWKNTKNMKGENPLLAADESDSKSSSIQTYVFGIIDRPREGTVTQESKNKTQSPSYLNDPNRVSDAIPKTLMIKTSGQLPCDSDFDAVYMDLDPSQQVQNASCRYEDFRRDETMCDSVSSSNTDRTTNTSYPSDENEYKSDNSVQSPTSSIDDNLSSEDTVADQSELCDRMVENKTMSFYDLGFVLGSDSAMTKSKLRKSEQTEENRDKSLGIYTGVSKRIDSLHIMDLQNIEDSSSCANFAQNQESQPLSYEDEHLEYTIGVYVSGVLYLAKESLIRDIKYAKGHVKTNKRHGTIYMGRNNQQQSINTVSDKTEDFDVSIEMAQDNMNSKHLRENINSITLVTDTPEPLVLDRYGDIPSTTRAKEDLEIIAEIEENKEFEESSDIEIPILKHKDSAECRNLSSKIHNVIGYEQTEAPANSEDMYSVIDQSFEQNKIREIHESGINRETNDSTKRDIDSNEYTAKRYKSTTAGPHTTIDVTSRQPKGNDKVNFDGFSCIKTCLKSSSEYKIQKKVSFLDTPPCHNELDEKLERLKEKSNPIDFNLTALSTKHGKEHVLTKQSFDTVKQILDTLLSTLDDNERQQTFATIKRHICKQVIPSLKQKPKIRMDKRSRTEIMRAKVRRTILYVTLQALKKAGKFTPLPSYTCIDAGKTSEDTAFYIRNYSKEYQMHRTNQKSSRVQFSENRISKCPKENQLMFDDMKKEKQTETRKETVADVQHYDYGQVPEYQTVNDLYSFSNYTDSPKQTKGNYIPKNLKVAEAMKKEEEAFDELERKVTSLYDRFMSKRSPMTESTHSAKEITTEKQTVDINKTNRGMEIDSSCPNVTVKLDSLDNLDVDYTLVPPTGDSEISPNASLDNLAVRISSSSTIPTESSSSSVNISTDSSMDNLAFNITSTHQQGSTKNDTGSLDSAYLSLGLDEAESSKYRLDETPHVSNFEALNATKNTKYKNDKCGEGKISKTQDKVPRIPRTYREIHDCKRKNHEKSSAKIKTTSEARNLSQSDQKDESTDFNGIPKKHTSIEAYKRKNKEVKRGSFQNLKVNVKSFLGRFSSKEDEGYLEKFQNKKTITKKVDPKHHSEVQGSENSSPNGKDSKKKKQMEKEQKNGRSFFQNKSVSKDDQVNSNTTKEISHSDQSEFTDQGYGGISSARSCHDEDTGGVSGKDECMEIDVENLFEKASSESIKAGLHTHGRLSDNIKISSAQRKSLQSMKELNTEVSTLIEQFDCNEDEVKTFLPVPHPKGAKFKRVITTPRGCST